MSNDLPAMPPAPEEEPSQRVPESVPGSIKAQAPAEPSGQPGTESVGEVGARLAQLRTQRGMSLEDVSARLKVAVVKLKALEGGDLSRLKDATFALGVVRSYAKILGADPEPLVRALRRAYGGNEQDLSMPASSGANLPRGKMSVNWRGAQPRRSGGWQWGVGVVVVAICLVLVFRDGRQPTSWFAHLKTKAQDSAASADAASGGAAAPVTATAASDALWPASGVDGGAPSDGNNAEQAGDTAPAASEPVALAPTAQTPALAAVSASASLPASAPVRATASAAKATVSTALPAVAASTATAASMPLVAKSAVVAGSASAAIGANAGPVALASQGASAAGQPGVSATLTFKVTEDSWVSVRQQDGREVFSGLVHPGDGQQVEGTRPLKVIVGNVHGIEAMDIDGQEANLKQYMNATGNVARFTLP